MPELPEVETLRLGLTRYIVDHTIDKVEVKLKKLVHGDIHHIEGAKIKEIKRFGKGLVIELDNHYAIAIHIKLTGQLIYRGPNAPKKITISKDKVGTVPNRWTHVIFHLDKGGLLCYNDLRQFGWIKIIKTEEVQKLPFFKELGPEPPVAKALEGQASLTLDKFKQLVKKAKGPIKPLLMDQTKMSGIGNIYANDGLFDAGIDPRRKTPTLSPKEIETLYNSILKVLQKGLTYHGATELNFVNALGEEGGYQQHFLVYAREGEKCRNCSSIIEKFKLGGRGTYVCPVCQR